MGSVKIREMRVKDILHYQDFALDLSDSSTSFHVLYGPNETGKTTLLSLIVDVLYGGHMPESSRSRYDNRSRLYATLEREDGTECRIERKRRYSQLELVDGESGIVTPEIVNAFLGGYQRERYTLLFGFDHERLRAGGQSLLDSQGQVGMSLFEAGSGIQHLNKLMNELDGRMTELLQPGFNAKSVKAINKLWQQYTKARQSMRASALRAEDWQQKRQEIIAAETELERTMKEREDVAGQLQKVARLVRVRPMLADRAAMEAELKDMDFALPMPESDITEIGELWKQHRLQLQEEESLERRRADLRGKLENLSEDPLALDVSGAIDSLTESLQQYLGLRVSIPEEREHLQQLQVQVQHQLDDLAPAISWNEVQNLRISRVAMDHIEELIEQIGEAKQSWAAEKRDLSRVTKEGAQARESLEMLGDVVDVSALEAVIHSILQSGDVEEQIRLAVQVSSAKREEMEQRIRQQGIYHGSWNQVMDLPLPLHATVDAFAEKWAASQGKIFELLQAGENMHKDLKDVDRTLAELNVQGEIPSEADLQQVRDVRNIKWDEVRRVWLTGASGNHEKLASELDITLNGADQVADLMIKAADRLAKRDIQTFRRRNLCHDIAENRATLEDARKFFGDLRGQWESEWPADLVTVKSPTEMREWLAQFWEPLRRLYQEHQDSVLTQHRVKTQQGQRLQQLVQEADRVQHSVDPDLTLSGALRLCEKYVNAQTTLLAQQKQYREQWAKAKVKTAEQKQRLEAAVQLTRQLEEQWRQLVSEHPALPASPDDAQHYTQYLKELLHSHNLWEQAASELHQHKNTCARFENEVKDTAELLGEDISQFLSEEGWVRHARDRVQRAQNTRRKMDDISVELIEVEEQLRSISLTIMDIQGYLEASQRKYHVTGVDALMDYATQAGRLAELKTKKKTLEDTIRQAADGTDAQVMDGELTSVADPDSLPTQQDVLQQKLTSLHDEYDRERDILKELQTNFAHLGEAGNQATAFAEEAQGYLAEIDQLWNEYLRIALAKRMLEQAIDSFRAQNESAVLKSAGEFFRAMTKSQYRELVVNYDKDIPYLEVVHGESGIRRRLAQLSDGTRDQLFLALRLAFLSQHLDHSEPLPLVMDDILVHFDDERTLATLEILQELSNKTQIIYFTHHQAVVDAAMLLQNKSGGIAIHDLGAALAGGVPS